MIKLSDSKTIKQDAVAGKNERLLPKIMKQHPKQRSSLMIGTSA